MKTMAYLLSCGKKWNLFWFQADYQNQVTLFRRIFAVIFFFFVLSRTPDLRLLYGPHGLLPVAVLRGFAEAHYRFSLLTVFDSLAAVWVFHCLLLISVAGLALGVFPGACALVAFVIQASFLNRDMIATYGVDALGTYYLFYLCFASFGSAAKKRSGDWRSTLGSAAYRMMQIQLCIVYAYSGLQKVRGATWWRGEGLWYALSNFQYAAFDFSWLSHYPSLLTAASYAVLAWEIYFPILVWFPAIRYPVLVFGVFLHLGIAFGMGLKSFGFLMIAFYALFLRPADAVKIAQCVKKFLTNRKVFLRKADQLSV